MAEVTNEVKISKRKRSCSDYDCIKHSTKKFLNENEETTNCDNTFVSLIASGLRTPKCRSPNVLGFMTPRHHNRQPPLPLLPWADRNEIWKVMMRDDELAGQKRSTDVFDNNPALMPRMRAILLDWLSEVCEVYRLHRETYYLAMDYVDRYLSRKHNVPKTQLQLLGITCLFIAAKVEEIYPPKLSEFSYVTDGACTDENILTKEVIVLRELNWNLTPMTINYWLCLFLQIYMHKTYKNNQNDDEPENTFIYPQYSPMDYETAIRICNLCAWNVGVFRFSYATIAASSLCYVYNRDIALSVTSISWKTLKPCVDWMFPFATVVKEFTSPIITGIEQRRIHSRTGLTKVIPNIIHDETHTMQTHNINLDMLDRAQQMLPRTPCKPSLLETPSKNMILTPPKSGRKSSLVSTDIDIDSL